MSSAEENSCEEELREAQERFTKEGLDWEALGSGERLLHVWRWLVDAESNLRSSRRMLDKLREVQHEELEEMEGYVAHVRQLAETRAAHLEAETVNLRSRLDAHQRQAATLGNLLQRSGLDTPCSDGANLGDDSWVGEQVALLIADRAKLMEEIEVLRKLKFSNGVNGMNKEGDLLSEVIKVSSEKEVLRREVSEMCERVQLLEKASRQLELDNERLAFKLSEALAELEERETQLRQLGPFGGSNGAWPRQRSRLTDEPLSSESVESPTEEGGREAQAQDSSRELPPATELALTGCVSSPRRLLLDSQRPGAGELLRIDEFHKMQSECEKLKGQVTVLTEKYNALAMRHLQYKAKRKAQVDDLRARLDVELSSLQSEVDALQARLAVQKKALRGEEAFRRRVEADYRRLQDDKRKLVVSVMAGENMSRDKEQEAGLLHKKVAMLERANSELLGRVLQLKYSARHVPAVAPHKSPSPTEQQHEMGSAV
ncbi:hypothetical protein B566_EDAN013632 [Ephemera danica]|nr:hypothetical protein B566_EDAN013632 [Ephemera danica]